MLDRLCLFLAKVDGKLTADNSGSFSVLTPNWGNFSLFFEEDPLFGTCLTPDMTDIDAMSLGGDWIETCFPDDEVVAAAKIRHICDFCLATLIFHREIIIFCYFGH